MPTFEAAPQFRRYRRYSSACLAAQSSQSLIIYPRQKQICFNGSDDVLHALLKSNLSN